MILNDQQIERYSRQIIVPGVGGRAQERLLGACAALVAEPGDAEAALAYLAGAGVGRIMIHPVGERAPYERIIARLRDLNPDVAATLSDDNRPFGGEAPPAPDLILALLGSARAVEAAASVCRVHGFAAAVIARLDAPARVAVLLAPPPCAFCADADLLALPGARGANAGVAAMVAVTEAFKLLAGFDEHPAPRMIEFAGYAATPRALGRRAGGARCCGCEAQ
jgi:hypothetical protein